MYYKLSFTVPESHCEIVKNAIFKAGAGKQDNYQRCSFQIKGEGQFEPLQGSNPFIGKLGHIEIVPEIKVETICEDKYIKNVIHAL